MNKKSRLFVAVDILYIGMIVIPSVFGMVLKVLTKPVEEGISISGAQIYFTVDLPFQDLPITESQVNSWLVMISILGLCLYLTHGLSTRNVLKRQHLVEWLIEKADSLIKDNMGEYFSGFSAFIASILALSAFSSLISLCGLYPPTSDINVVAGWAVIVFVLITYYKFKCGPIEYIKSFGDPVPLLAPLNVISEVATPVSMAFRHYGNVLSGTVISVLLATGLQGLSSLILGWLPGFLSDIPLHVQTYKNLLAP